MIEEEGGRCLRVQSTQRSQCEVTMFKGGLSPPPTNEEPQITWKEKGREGKEGEGRLGAEQPFTRERDRSWIWAIVRDSCLRLHDGTVGKCFHRGTV